MPDFRPSQRVEFNEKGIRYYRNIIEGGAPKTFVIEYGPFPTKRESVATDSYMTADGRTLYADFLRPATFFVEPNPMTIWMIWVFEKEDDGRVEPWLFDAMDEASVQANSSGWADLLDTAQNQYRDRVRVIRTEVDYTGIKQAFETASVRSTGLVVEP